MNASPEILTRENGATIAYHRTPGRAPGVMFLGGFMSDMTGTKALALERFCRERGQAYVRFDYQGHGQSSGRFADGTIGTWAADALAVFDKATEGPQVLVGSSMGGWIMLIAALARRDRVAGLLGIAPAPDFVTSMWEGFDPEVRATLTEHGVYYAPSDYSDEPYAITMALIEEGRQHLLLDNPIELDCRVRLLHGMKDPEVPWGTSLKIIEMLTSKDAEVTLVKDGDHRLSEPADIARLCRTVAALCDGTEDQ